MATIGFRFAYGDKDPDIRVLPEHATSGSFKVGDLVKLTSGKVVKTSDDQTLCWGIAAKAASGTEDTDIPVYILTTDQVWIVEADDTTAASQVGEDYGLNIATAGSMSVDIGDTSTTSVRVIALHPADGAKANGRLLVRFRAAVLQSA